MPVNVPLMPNESVSNSANPEELIAAASRGGEERLGRLLALYRNYLRLLARIEIGGKLQAKVDASDLVQETMLEAHKNFPQFRGATEAEFTAWLRQIMAGVVCGLLRRYFGTQKRDLQLERTFRENLGNSSLLFEKGFVDLRSSPSQQAARREQVVLLADALENLPKDYREVLVLRHMEGLTFPDIANRMERTQDSVEKLWVRGLARLRKEMEAIQ
jgi:RNA polymerase sigma-70 factor (ECF subfamily)